LCLLFLSGCTAFAQTSEVRGVVTDTLQKPIVGATVTVKGTKSNAITSPDGNFSIKAKIGDVLTVSAVGFSNNDVTVTSLTNVNIKLTATINALNDVVVVGYGTQRKASITGAITTINSEEITKTPATTTSAALVGKMPGITARATDSRPGNGVNLQIRNLGNPLYVIDGIPYNTNYNTTAFGTSNGNGQDVFNSLGLDDIESITILKDASASVYGLRASNGVVLVTTKKGKKSEKPTINVSGYYGLQNFTRYPHPANAGEYVTALVQSEQNLGRDPSLLYPKSELDKWVAGTDSGYKSYDYYKEVLRPNVPQSFINASASGGSQRSTYFVSVSHLSQDALLKDFNYSRTNLQTNLETSLAKGLKVGTQISARLEKRHNVGVPGLDDYFNPFLSIFSMWPTESPYANDNPNYINQTHNVNVNPATYRDNITGYADEAWRAMNVNLNAQYDFNFGLSVKGTYSYNYMNEDFDGFEYTWDAYKYNAATGQYETQPGYGNQNPWRETHRRNVVSRFAQLQLSYNKQFGAHSISAVAAYERSDYNNAYSVVHTVPTNNYISVQTFAEQDYLADELAIEAREGYVGRVNYNYKQKYLLELLGRYDGSFLYAPGSRFGFFPGISAGWRISQENFYGPGLKNILNDLKIRASYGTTGSEIGDPNGNPPAAFSYLGGYSFNQYNSVFNGTYVIGSRPRGLPITELSWVMNRTKNIGIDFALFNSKITGQFDLFERKRTGLPAARYDVLLPSEVGYTLPNENLNSDATRGFDGSVVYNGSAGKNLTYSIGVNGTYGRLRNLSTYKPRFGNSYEQYTNSIEDRWATASWGYHVIGRFQSEAEIKKYDINNDGQGNTTELPGDFMYQDVNGDKIINYLDRKPIGYAQGAQPYVSFGLNGSVEYKGISLSFTFAGATMQSFFRNWELRYPFQNNGSSPAYMLTDVWHQADPYDPNSAWIPGTYPAIRKNNTTHVNYADNDFWLTNVSYLRLRNLEVGYSFPKQLISRFGISAFRVYVNGTNLFSFDNVNKFEIDPEISSQNGMVYPQQRLLNFGFNLSL